MVKAPERMETERLRIRRPCAEDAEAVFAYARDPDVTRYMSFPRQHEIGETRAFLAASDREWADHLAGPYLIERREAPGVIGGTGLHGVADGKASTGYLLARAHWGHGYASEALEAMVSVARAIGLHTLEASVHPDNAASVRVLEKCGFERVRGAPERVLFPQLDPEQPLDAWCYAFRLDPSPASARREPKA